VTTADPSFLQTWHAAAHATVGLFSPAMAALAWIACGLLLPVFVI